MDGGWLRRKPPTRSPHPLQDAAAARQAPPAATAPPSPPQLAQQTPVPDTARYEAVDDGDDAVSGEHPGGREAPNDALEQPQDVRNSDADDDHETIGARLRRHRLGLHVARSEPSSSSDEAEEEENQIGDLDRLLHEDDSVDEDDGNVSQADDRGDFIDQMGLEDDHQWTALAEHHPGLFMFEPQPMARRRNEFAMHFAGGRGGGERAVVDLQNTQADAAQEIDLTTLSSDSEDDHAIVRGGGNADADGEDDEDEIEIVGSTAPLMPMPIQRVGGLVPSRKRRRQNSDNAAIAPTRPFDTHSAESTNISLENNETIERFKSSLKCSVCLEVIEEMTSTICGHVYCGKCIRLAISVTHKCPLCQRPLRPTDIHGLFF